MIMSIMETTKEYFKTFTNKDLSGLGEMFAENISLCDWEIQAQGKEEVLLENQKIFNSVESINVNPVELYEDKNTVLAELEILVNKHEIIYVIDVIDFDENGKIIAIKAYKR